nr:MAG TPA: hypothetical protein [Caudoviricetes sp.]
MLRFRLSIFSMFLISSDFLILTLPLLSDILLSNTCSQQYIVCNPI